MESGVAQAPAERLGDSEKITINLGFVDLGRIDLLVRDGFYSNRADFIRTAIRNQLAAQADELKGAMSRHRFELGVVRLGRSDLERLKQAGEMLELHVIGFASLADDIDADLGRATIRSISVLGHLNMSRTLRDALSDRIR
jgi:Arc/MetJ-type ribon-helix-helix transcriptional regulator